MPRTSLFLFVILASPSVIYGQTPQLVPSDWPIAKVIDHYVAEKIKEAKLQTAPRADDATLIRRLTLDLIGRIPTLAETNAYLASTESDKKARLVERLLASPGFVRHQADEFLALLQVADVAGKPPRRGGLHDYLLTSFKENRSWDRMFRELMLPNEAEPDGKKAGEFLKGRVKDLNRMTIDVSNIFFGVNVSCAQCHDHPHVPNWTQDHFYGMKSFFARTVESGGYLGEKDFGVVKYTPNKGKEKVAPVMFLTGKTFDVPGIKEPNAEQKKKEQDRLGKAKKGKKDKDGKAPPPPDFSIRAKLVETALEPTESSFFSRAIVNRLWHRFHGRGLVTPLDQMHLQNPPSHPELLAWLAHDFATHGHDLKRLIHGLVLSDTYARASRWEGDDYPQDRFFAIAQPRPLTPAQMAVSLKLASADPKTFESGDVQARLANLENSAGRLMNYFPMPGDNFQISVSEAMLFANNTALLKELLEGSGSLVARLKDVADPEHKADLTVRVVLNRPARADEIQALADYLRRRPDRPQAAAQQIVWALLTSAEFRFNH